jgi:hypothetical protein
MRRVQTKRVGLGRKANVPLNQTSSPARPLAISPRRRPARSAAASFGIFFLVEEFILPFVLDHARPQLRGDDERVRALLNFASEEAKHIHLFRASTAVSPRLPGRAAMIGPSEAIAAEVLRHDPLSVALVILMIEWMTQQPLSGLVRDDGDLDPLFKSLLKHHWMEEAQHAKLDTLMVEALADGRDEAGDPGRDRRLSSRSAPSSTTGSRPRRAFNLDAFERHPARCAPTDRELQAQQHQALRWTYLGSGMVHPNASRPRSPPFHPPRATASPPPSPGFRLNIKEFCTNARHHQAPAGQRHRPRRARRNRRRDRGRMPASVRSASGSGPLEGPDQANRRSIPTLSPASVVPRSFTIVADEPCELLGTDAAPNPQELLMSAFNACMMVGYVAQASVRGITLDTCRIETEGELDLRGFLGLDETVPAGYRRISYTVFLEGRRHPRAVRGDPPGGDGDLAQLLQHGPADPDGRPPGLTPREP